MTEAVEIELSAIKLRKELSPRSSIDSDVVAEYVINIDDLPPILVAIDREDSEGYVLIDGWHRYYAHQNADRLEIMAIVDEKLEAKDFFFRAICANKAHGIRFNAEEKKRISKYLFMSENRSAAEISQAIGCSVRHATDLIKDLAHKKKQDAIKLAKNLAITGYSQRDIAEELVKRGFKASKSGVDRWLKPKPQDFTKEIETINESQKTPPQIGESPKRDSIIDWGYSGSKLRNNIESVHVKLAGIFNELSYDKTDFFIEFRYEKESIIQYLDWISGKITFIRERVESIEILPTEG